MSKTQTIARALAPAIVVAAALTCVGRANAANPAAGFSEGFDSKSGGFAARQWTQQNNSTNNSTAPGSEPEWGQGGDGFPFFAHSGANDSYVTANYLSVSDGPGPDTISNWLISPTLGFKNGDVVSFYTKSEFNSIQDFSDRLQLRFSKAAVPSVGTGPDDVGTFTTLLLDINPTLALQGQPGAYPTEWTKFTGQITGLNPNATTLGAIAFRYFVPDGGPGSTTNSNRVGIDSVEIQAGIAPVPEPAAYLMMALGLGVIGLRRMRATRG